MTMIVDIFLLAIVIIAFIIGIKRGFARTALELVSFFLTLFLAFQMATPIATKCYDNLVAPRVAKKIEENLNTKVDMDGKPMAVITEALPSFVRPYAEQQAAKLSAAFSQMKHTTSNNTELGMKLEENMLRPIAVKAFSSLFFFVLFAVLGLFLHFLAVVISKAFELPILSAINATLGGVLGLLRGGVFMFATSLLLLFLSTEFGGNFATAVGASKIIAFLQSHLSSIMTL